MTSFKYFFTFKDFIDVFNREFTESQAIRFGSAVRSYFRKLADEGILTVPEDNWGNHSNKFLGALRRVVNDEQPHPVDGEAFSTFLKYQLAGIMHVDGNLENKYSHFVEIINVGDFYEIDFDRSDVCLSCGSTLALEADRWNFSVHSYVLKKDSEGVSFASETHCAKETSELN